MHFPIVRHVATLALVAAAATSACSNSTPPPDVFIESYIQGTTYLGPLCPYGSRTTWIDIGTPTGDQPVTVANGGLNGGGKVTVNCTVHPVGNGFDIVLNTSLSGQGSVTIQSAQGKGAIDPVNGGQVSTTFEASTGKFTEQNCTLTYTYQDQAVPANPSVAAGRIWGHVSCTMAQEAYGMVMLPDGGAAANTCDTEADFRFEFCNE